MMMFSVAIITLVVLSILGRMQPLNSKTSEVPANFLIASGIFYVYEMCSQIKGKLF